MSVREWIHTRRYKEEPQSRRDPLTQLTTFESEVRIHSCRWLLKLHHHPVRISVKHLRRAVRDARKVWETIWKPPKADSAHSKGIFYFLMCHQCPLLNLHPARPRISLVWKSPYRTKFRHRPPAESSGCEQACLRYKTCWPLSSVLHSTWRKPMESGSINYTHTICPIFALNWLLMIKNSVFSLRTSTNKHSGFTFCFASIINVSFLWMCPDFTRMYGLCEEHLRSCSTLFSKFVIC